MENKNALKIALSMPIDENKKNEMFLFLKEKEEYLKELVSDTHFKYKKDIYGK